MPSRYLPFVNGQYYHLFNRGVAKMPIYLNKGDYSRFVRTMVYYQIADPKPRFSIFSEDKFNMVDKSQKIVEIICYCLMPNHFHFLIKQLKDGGICEFVSKISNSHARYFNIKNKRVGPILQGEFKAVLVEDDNQLLHVNRYIHLNPVASFITQDLENYPWSSYPEYIGKNNQNICEKEEILSFFPSIEAYKQFVLDQKDYAQTLERIKHLSLE